MRKMRRAMLQQAAVVALAAGVSDEPRASISDCKACRTGILGGVNVKH